MTIITDPTDPDVNSYITIAESNVFLLEERMHAETWGTLGDDVKEKLLRWATSLFDTMWLWNGELVDGVFALFPRTVDLVEIEAPGALKRSVAEVAFLLNSFDRTKPVALLEKGFKVGKVDVMNVELDHKFIPKIFPDYIQAMLEPYGIVSGMVNTSSRIANLKRN